jgi:hypothetical protein
MHWPRSTNDRRHFIGGSDARVIMGEDEKVLIRLWQEKRGEVGPEGLSDTHRPVRGGPVKPHLPDCQRSHFLAFPEPNAGAATIFINELDTGRFQSFPRFCTHFIGHGRPKASLEAFDRYQ